MSHGSARLAARALGDVVRRGGVLTAGVAALALLAAAVAGWSAAGAPVRAPAAAGSPRPVGRRRVAAGRSARPAGGGRLLLPAGPGCGAALLVGRSPVGCCSGCRRRRRCRLAAAPGAWPGCRSWELLRRGVERDLPVACDLLAVCLAAGVPVAAALAGRGPAVAGPLRERLREVAAMYRLGADPAQAWAAAPAGAGARWAASLDPGRRSRVPRSVPPCARSPPSSAAADRAGPRRPCAGRACGCWRRSALASCPPSSAWASCRWCSASPAEVFG